MGTKESKIAKLGEFKANDIGTVLNVRITFIDQLLGACPYDEEIYKTYLASEWRKKEKKYNQSHSDEITKKISEEAEKLPTLEEEMEEMKLTVFLRDKDGNPAIDQHVIKGFFKNAAKAFYSINKSLPAYKTKIDNLIFVGPDLITINTDKEISILERPLRAETAQGPRVALAASEVIAAGAYIDIQIKIMDPNLEPHVMDWLNYGELNGLGQWHNGGKGRFKFELINN